MGVLVLCFYPLHYPRVYTVSRISARLQLLARSTIVVSTKTHGKIRFWYHRTEASNVRISKGSGAIKTYYANPKREDDKSNTTTNANGGNGDGDGHGYGYGYGAFLFCVICGVHLIHAPSPQSTFLGVNACCIDSPVSIRCETTDSDGTVGASTRERNTTPTKPKNTGSNETAGATVPQATETPARTVEDYNDRLDLRSYSVARKSGMGLEMNRTEGSDEERRTTIPLHREGGYTPPLSKPQYPGTPTTTEGSDSTSSSSDSFTRVVERETLLREVKGLNQVLSCTVDTTDGCSPARYQEKESTRLTPKMRDDMKHFIGKHV